MAVESGLTRGRIFRFWAPLAATWLMMAVEGPFITAVIARAGEAAVNLAAFGVAFALAMLLESPVILLLSASTALVHDTASYARLRNFTWALCGLVTLLWAVVMAPPVFAWVGGSLMGLPPEVAHRANVACAVLLPWPAAIGYRRFYQGLLIRSGRTRMVAYGTVTRLTAMVTTALAVSATGTGRGALLGAMALSSGVVVEAAASRFMARRSLRELAPTPAGAVPVMWGTAGLPMTYAAVTRFYVPLALTSLLQLGVNPLVAAFLGRGRLPLESLAVQPVVNALVFVFRSMGMAFQEVAIALRGERGEGYPALGRFAGGLALAP